MALQAPMQRCMGPRRQAAVRVEAKKPTVHQRIADKNKTKSGSSSGTRINPDRLCNERDYKPARQAFNVALHRAPTGSRVGIQTTAPVIASELLLVSEPLAYTTAPAGTELRPVDLLKELQAKQPLPPADNFRLNVLNHGNKEAAKQLTSLEQLLDAAAYIKQKQEAAKKGAAKKGFGAAASAAAKTTDAVSGTAAPTPGQLEAIVKLNAYGHEHMDLGMAGCRGEPQAAFIGIWPELAIINHSCAPNALAIPVADRMLLRVARPIPQGGEVTVSHLHELIFAPLQERRASLQLAYGYKCNCARCKLEEAQPAEVQQQLQSMWEKLGTGSEAGMSFQARARSAVNAKDRAVVKEVVGELQGWVQQLEGAMEKCGVAPEDRSWLKASAYSAYELLAVCQDELSGGTDPQWPASLLLPVMLVAPGTDRHLMLSADRLLKAAEVAKMSPETEVAAKECIVAHSIRYGAVSDGTLARLINARSLVDQDMGRFSVDSINPTLLAGTVPDRSHLQQEEAAASPVTA